MSFGYWSTHVGICSTVAERTLVVARWFAFVKRRMFKMFLEDVVVAAIGKNKQLEDVHEVIHETDTYGIIGFSTNTQP